MLILLTTMMLIFVLNMTWKMLTSKEKEKQMKNSTFESGFESSNSSLIPFSSQYFMVATVFMIFDLEIVLTIPLPMTSEKIKSSIIMSMFLMMLTILLMKEMKINTIEWVK